MENVLFYIGIDIASQTHTAAVYVVGNTKQATITFANTDVGFEEFSAWLSGQGIMSKNSIVCMESTGVYGEALTYYLAAHRWKIVVEAPQKVKRGMNKQVKNDRVDACQIAEYAYRYADTLAFWQAPTELVKRIETLLTTRRHCVHEKTATGNMLTALRRHVVRTPFAEKILEQQCANFKEQIHAIDKELEQEIKSDTRFTQMIELAKSVPGVGPLLSAHFLVLTNGFTKVLNHRNLASYLGICPHEHSSGTSVYRRPTSRHSGPGDLRGMLFLASMSLVQHQKQFKQYFERKKAQHKPGRLILNNIANKLLKILCAVLQSGVKYNSEHISMKPVKKAMAF